MTIDESFVKVSPTASSSVVYRVQLLGEQDLSIIQTNVSELIAFHTYILATKDLLTARTIARQAADRGLLVIMLQIEIPAHKYVLELDNNRLMFRFGTIFRIRSIDLAPDSVWYGQLKYADSDFQSIQERLQLQIGEPLTWLTLGTYLCTLNHFNEAKAYYEYLLKLLPNDHQALATIYNNMGSMFIGSGDDEKAVKCYKVAMNLFDKISPNTDDVSEGISFNTPSQSVGRIATIDCCTLYDKMAEGHLRQSEYDKALKCYQKALQYAIDPFLRIQFEQKIKNILSLMS